MRSGLPAANRNVGVRGGVGWVVVAIGPCGRDVNPRPVVGRILAQVQLRILGPLEVLDDDGHPLDVGGARPRAVLVDLALGPGRTVPADQLLEDVWSGEQPARNNLQVHIARLRRVLGDDRIVTRNGGYALDVPPDAVDAHRFDRLADAGHVALAARDPGRGRRCLRDALALWRGAPLVEFAEDEFARPVITRLEECASPRSRIGSTPTCCSAAYRTDRRARVRCGNIRCASGSGRSS